MKTKRQLVEETEEWVRKNPDAYRALVEASKAISDKGKDTPFKFLVEVLRYNCTLGKDVMDAVIDALDGFAFAKGEYAISNDIVSGLARRISKELEGYEGFHANLKRSRFDEPDGEGEQLALF